MKLWMIDENSRKYSIFQIMLDFRCIFEIDVYIHDLSNLLLIVK